MFGKWALSCFLLTVIAGCSTATKNDTGAVVLDISDPEAINSSPETTPEFISAYDALKAKEFTRAEALLDTSLSQKPKDPYALLVLGTIHERTGRFATAADLYQSAEHYGAGVIGPRLLNGIGEEENAALTVGDIARENLAILESQAILRR